MRFDSFLNYIVFEIQYIVSNKSSSFSDRKRASKFRLTEALLRIGLFLRR